MKFNCYYFFLYFNYLHFVLFTTIFGWNLSNFYMFSLSFLTVVSGTYFPCKKRFRNNPFIIYKIIFIDTAPPKTILNEDTKLLDSGCVPNAILHFGTTDLSKDLKYLKADLFSKYTTASVASLAAAKIR